MAWPRLFSVSAQSSGAHARGRSLSAFRMAGRQSSAAPAGADTTTVFADQFDPINIRKCFRDRACVASAEIVLQQAQH